MHRALQLGAGLALALAILTCTDERVTGPAQPGRLLLDVHVLQAGSPGQPVIPFDSLRITLRRPTETAYAYDKTVLVRSDTVKGDSVVLRLDVQLQRSSEDFVLDVTTFGAGIAWYALTATVHLTAGATAAPSPFLARYVGLGHNAKAVRVFPVDTTAIGGTSFPLRSVVTDPSDTPISGVPVGYRLSDATHGSVTSAYLSASFTAAAAVRDSAWVFAETPTHLRDSTRIHIVPPAASFQKVSGDAQTAVLGAPLKNPLVVRVLDALSGGFKGDTVRWTVTTANATLTAPFSVSDDTGYALVSLTPSALGPVTVQAAVAGLSGSPQTFTVTATAGTVAQVVISPKLDTIARGNTVQYTAVAKDASGNVVTTLFNWISTVQTIATINSSGLAAAVAGDSTFIIAAVGGHADTAKLYVRALRTVAVSPADTIVTAVNDSFQLTTTAKDNFGATMSSGFTTSYSSGSPTIVVVTPTGQVRSVGPGIGVIVVRDSVDPQLVMQGSATIRINQVTRTIFNRPGDSVVVGATGKYTIVLHGSDSSVVGISGQTQIVAIALDSNGYPIPGKTFGWSSRNTGIATVTATGIVTGVAIGSSYVADSVDGLLDSTRVAVVAPALSLGTATVTLGTGQIFPVQYVLLNNTVTGLPLVVHLTHSDSLPGTPTSALVFGLSADSVIIPVGSSFGYVSITGQNVGTANLIASAGGYTPASSTVNVRPATLYVFLPSTTPAGQRDTVIVSAGDDMNGLHAVAKDLTVTLTSTNPTHALFGSATLLIPAGAYYAATGVVFDTAGTYTVTASAPGYTAGVTTTTTMGALVRMQNLSFGPPSVMISAGQYVTWQNTDATGLTHTATSDTPGQFDTGDIAPGMSVKVSFATPGTYYYHCKYHGTVGMVGVVIVR